MDFTFQDSRTQERDATDDLTETMLKMMIDDRNMTDNSPGSTGVPVAKAPDAFSGVTARASLLFNQVANGQYKELSHLDELVNSRCQEVLSRLDSLASPDSAVDRDVLSFLEEEEDWLKVTLAKVKIFVTANQSVALLKSALVDRLDDIIDAVDCYKLILSERSPDQTEEEPDLYDAGQYIFQPIIYCITETAY